MKTPNLLIIIGSIFILFLCSCEKETVEGPQGPQGEQGPAGEDGQDGNSNVETFEFTIETEDWEWYAPLTRFRYRTTLPITDDIYENGAVLTFFRLSTIWTQLPYTNVGDDNVSNLWADHNSDNENNVIFYYKRSSWNSSTSENDSGVSAPQDRTYKVVLIDGAGITANDDINMSDYEEVSKLLDL